MASIGTPKQQEAAHSSGLKASTNPRQLQRERVDRFEVVVRRAEARAGFFMAFAVFAGFRFGVVFIVPMGSSSGTQANRLRPEQNHGRFGASNPGVREWRLSDTTAL